MFFLSNKREGFFYPFGEFALTTSVGRSAERYVESWLEAEGWLCFERNMRVPGGEIDRVFVRERPGAGFKVDLCVAEVKATRLRQPFHLDPMFCAARMKSLLRPNQVRVLWRTAAAYEQRLRALTRAPVRTFVRYFLLVQGERRQIHKLAEDVRIKTGDHPFRICKVSENELLLAWSPEVQMHPF